MASMVEEKCAPATWGARIWISGYQTGESTLESLSVYLRHQGFPGQQLEDDVLSMCADLQILFLVPGGVSNQDSNTHVLAK